MSDFWNHQAGSQVLGTSLGVEAIQEFALLTNTYSAQFGGNGSVMNAASKSGTNDFHGSAYEFLRNSALDSRSYFEAASQTQQACRFAETSLAEVWAARSRKTNYSSSEIMKGSVRR